MSAPGWDERRVTEIERQLSRLEEIKANVSDVQKSMHIVEGRLDRHGQQMAKVAQEVEQIHIDTAVMRAQLGQWVEHNRWMLRSIATIVVGLLTGLLVYLGTAH